MRSLIEYFGCGNVYIRERAVDFIVQKSSDLDSKIIPFFKKYPVPTHPAEDRGGWREIPKF